MPTIRKATPDDLAVIQALNQKLFIHEQTHIPFFCEEWPYTDVGTDYFKRSIIDKRSQLLVLDDEEKVVGYMMCWVYKKPSLHLKDVLLAEIENTFIEEKYRHQGYGKKMFTMLKKWAKEQGANRMHVGMVTNNLDTVRFYKSIGFQPYETKMDQPL